MSKKKIQFHLRDGNDFIQKEDLKDEACPPHPGRAWQKTTAHTNKLNSDARNSPTNCDLPLIPLDMIDRKTAQESNIESFARHQSCGRLQAMSNSKSQMISQRTELQKEELQKLEELREMRSKSLLKVINTGVHQCTKSIENLKFQDNRKRNIHDFKKIFQKIQVTAREKHRTDKSPYFKLEMSQRGQRNDASTYQNSLLTDSSRPLFEDRSMRQLPRPFFSTFSDEQEHI